MEEEKSSTSVYRYRLCRIGTRLKGDIQQAAVSDQSCQRDLQGLEHPESPLMLAKTSI